MLLMWFILGILTVLFFRFGHVLDHGKPIFMGVIVNTLLLWRFMRILAMLDVSILGSLAGLAFGAATMVLTTDVFFQHTAARGWFVLKWFLIGGVCLAFFVSRLRRLGTDLQPLNDQVAAGRSGALPENFGKWSELEQLRHMEAEFSADWGQAATSVNRPRVVAYLGVAFLFAGVMMYLIPLNSRELGMPLISVGLFSIAAELGVSVLQRKWSSKLNELVAESEANRKLIADEIRARITQLEKEESGSQ